MQAGANYVPSLREYAARWGVTPERLRPGQKVMHPGPMNRGVEIDPRVADSADALVETQVRSGPRRPHGGALRPADRRARRRTGARGGGGGVMLCMQEAARATNVVVRGARVLDPTEGVDAILDVRIDDGTIAAIGESLDANEHRVVDGAGLVLAPAFVDPHVHLRTPGREDEETIASGTAAAAAGGYCAILAMPNTDPVVDSRGDARRARRDRGPRGGDRGRLPRRDHARPGRRGADRDGRARRRRRGRVLRRRRPGRHRPG